MEHEALRPSDDVYKKVYEKAFLTWLSLCNRASRDCRLPADCLQVDRLFPQHAHLPIGLEVDDDGLLTATSTWVATDGSCDMPSFEQRFEMCMYVATCTPVRVTNNSNVGLPRWFGQEGVGNHLAVLMLAWAYALSARWAMMMSRAAPLEYTDCQAGWAGDQIHAEDATCTIIELGALDDDDAARWWAAVLAPGQGWKASIPHKSCQLLSPWTVILESVHTILLSSASRSRTTPPSSPSPPSPPSFEAAMRYIEEYSALHSAGEQSRVALAAALLLPLANLDRRTISLPPPRMCHERASSTVSKCPAWGQDLRQLDRPLTLSCNAWGMRSVLGSVFYEPEIPCNACGAWLQGTMAVLQSNHIQDLHVLASMLFIRSPHLSFLWLGGIITGAHRSFMRNAYGLLGLNRIDLHEAAWTGPLLSFIQEPVSHLLHDTKSISRADECRLEYLCQGLSQDKTPPIYPYPPPGETAIEDVNLDVRAHALCPGSHGLRYSKISWPCVGGRREVQEAKDMPILSRNPTILSPSDIVEAVTELDYGQLDREKDLSDGVTRNIFLWMREIDGFTVAERDVYKELFDGFESDDDESLSPEGDGKSLAGWNMPASTCWWLSRSLTTRCNSL